MSKPPHLIPGTPEYAGYKNMRTREWRIRTLLRKQRGLCYVCKEPLSIKDHEGPDYATIEHVIPLSKGGKDDLSNLAVSHQKCNTQKGNKVP